MNLVARNLSDSEKKYTYNCNEFSDIPNSNNYGLSICHMKSLYGNIRNAQSYYKRDYVETIYKKLFGSSAKLDTNASFKMDRFYGVTYTYVPKYDAYFEYEAQTGGTGPDSYSAELSKAYKEGNKIYI